MLTEINYPDDRFYKTGLASEPSQFYFDALSKSNHLDLVVGKLSLFSVSSFSFGLSNFICKDGEMRIIFNTDYDERDLLKFFESLENRAKHFFDCLAYLISQKRLQLHCINPADGLPFYKTGIFSDGKYSVSFDSSTDFNINGCKENLEEVEVYLSWEGKRSTIMIDKRKVDFQEMMLQQKVSNDIIKIIELLFAGKSLDELVKNERILISDMRLQG